MLVKVILVRKVRDVVLWVNPRTCVLRHHVGLKAAVWYQGITFGRKWLRIKINGFK